MSKKSILFEYEKNRIGFHKTGFSFDLLNRHKSSGIHEKSLINILAGDAMIIKKKSTKKSVSNRNSAIDSSHSAMLRNSSEEEVFVKPKSKFILTAREGNLSSLDSKSLFNSNLRRNSLKYKTQSSMMSNYDFSEKKKEMASTQNNTFIHSILQRSGSVSKIVSPNESNFFNLQKPKGLSYDEFIENLKFQRINKKENEKHKNEMKKMINLISKSRLSKNKNYSKSSHNFFKSKGRDSDRNPFRSTSHHTTINNFKTVNKEDLEIKLKKVENEKNVKTPEKKKSLKIKFDLSFLDEKKKTGSSFGNFGKKQLVVRGKESPIKIKQNYQSTIDEMVQKNKNEHMFNSPEALKNHLIRDHKIGESNHVLVSKRKFESTMKIYNDIDERKRKKNEEEQAKFLEKMTKPKKFIETEENETAIQRAIERNLDQEYNECKRDEIRKNFEKAKEESKRIGDLIKDISEDEYEEFTAQGSLKIKNGVHLGNLDRMIRVRNILKQGYDKESDYLGLENPKKFKETKKETDFELFYSMRGLGAPNFLKTKFKLSTIDKCKNVDGLFFGSSAR